MMDASRNEIDILNIVNTLLHLIVIEFTCLDVIVLLECTPKKEGCLANKMLIFTMSAAFSYYVQTEKVSVSYGPSLTSSATV